MTVGKNTLLPGQKRFELKAGREGFQWRGVFSDGDPSTNAPGRPRLLINGRFFGGGFIDRPGLTPFNASEMQTPTACIIHIDDYDPAKPVKLWIRGDGCPGVSSSAGFFIGCLDPEQSPEFQRTVHYDLAVTALHMAVFDGAIHLSTDGTLRRLTFLAQPWGTEGIQTAGSSQDTIIKAFAGFTISCLRAFDGKLFIGLDAGAGASKIVTWDGLSLRDDLTAINPPTSFGLYHAPSGGDTLIVGFAAATNNLRYRPTGDSPGTWTTLAPGAGTLASVTMVPYKDTLYIADGGANVWAYDANAATITIARSPATAVAVRALEVFNGRLYYGWETAAEARVGKFDGSTWTDVEKNLTTQFATARSVRALAAYRGNLFAAGVTAANGGRLYVSPLTLTADTWLEVTPNVTNNGDLDFLLVA